MQLSLAWYLVFGTWYFALAGRLVGSAQTPGADIDALAQAAHGEGGFTYIGQPAAAGVPLGMADVVAEN